MAETSADRETKNQTKVHPEESPKAPIQLEFFVADDLAVCDAETAVCTVPRTVDSDPAGPNPREQQPAFDKRAAEHSEPSGNS